MSHIKKTIIILDEENFSFLGIDRIHRKEIAGKRIQIIHHKKYNKFLYKSFEIVFIAFE